MQGTHDHRPGPVHRRSFLARSLLSVSAVAAVGGPEERSVLAALQEGAHVSPEERASAAREPMPCGKIGKASISRLMLGSNLIGGFAHSRDLLYVSQLFQEYNTEAKIFDTFELAEQTGINAILTNPTTLDFVQRYNQQRGGKLQAVVYVRAYDDAAAAKQEVDTVVEKGACAISTHGGETDKLVRDGQLEPLARTIELIHGHGLPAGLGGHSLEVPKVAEAQQLGADFYHKTFHHDRYWSATPAASRQEWCWYQPVSGEHGDYHDNMFCLNPQETADFMATVQKPWIAFKVLAAGAIDPGQGFSHAFRHGADFICCGMFDFQVCQDALLVKDILRKLDRRARPWMA